MGFSRCFAAALLASAVVSANAAGAERPVWDGVPWRIDSIGGASVADSSRTSLAITADGKVAGASGCNRFAGKALFDKGLRFGPLASTRMACPPPLMEQERALFRALTQVRSARQQGEKLELLSESGALLVTLAR